MTLDDRETWLQKATRMQDQLLSLSTGGVFDGSEGAFKKLRNELLGMPNRSELVPDFVKDHRDLGS